jgi:hypothetical protein
MPLEEFDPPNSASERTQDCALDSVVTGIGLTNILNSLQIAPILGH